MIKIRNIFCSFFFSEERSARCVRELSREDSASRVTNVGTVRWSVTSIVMWKSTWHALRLPSRALSCEYHRKSKSNHFQAKYFFPSSSGSYRVFIESRRYYDIIYTYIIYYISFYLYTYLYTIMHIWCLDITKYFLILLFWPFLA